MDTTIIIPRIRKIIPIINLRKLTSSEKLALNMFFNTYGVKNIKIKIQSKFLNPFIQLLKQFRKYATANVESCPEGPFKVYSQPCVAQGKVSK